MNNDNAAGGAGGDGITGGCCTDQNTPASSQLMNPNRASDQSDQSFSFVEQEASLAPEQPDPNAAAYVTVDMDADDAAVSVPPPQTAQEMDEREIGL